MPAYRSLLNSVKALPSNTPLQSVYSWHPALAHQLHNLAVSKTNEQAFELVHIEHLRGARYGLQLKKSLGQSGLRIPLVWDSVDCITHLFRQAASQSSSFFGRWLTRLELSRTERFEGWLTGQFNRVLVTSENDRNALLSLPLARVSFPSISVIPNGVDLEYFSPYENQARTPAELVISGKMSYHANISMTLYLVNEILPLVWERRPDVRLTVVGKDPPREIQTLSNNPAITVTGTVDDIRPYLRRATAAVVPITYGAGIQNKVLEAMACATPVISSPQAVSALSAISGEEVMVASSPAAFADEILRLIDQPSLQRRIGQAGRQYVETHHRWDSIAGQLEDIYTEVVRSVKAY